MSKTLQVEIPDPDDTGHCSSNCQMSYEDREDGWICVLGFEEKCKPVFRHFCFSLPFKPSPKCPQFKG